MDHVISDPPYSAVVHGRVKSGDRRRLPDKSMSACRINRTVDLGFEHIDPALRWLVARESVRMTRRWMMFFADAESVHLWRESVEYYGAEHIRAMPWIKLGGAPAFTGDRPAAGAEMIELAHRPGRKRWHGGGKAGVYVHPVAANRAGARHTRVHTTQKPDGLMLDLVRDFTDEDDVIFDMFAGSGTTGYAALRLGRRCILIERDATYAKLSKERCEAEERDQDVVAYRAGQERLFHG